MQPVPRTRRTAQNTQYTYPLDCRVYDVKTYPVRSPQGATVLIYGHSNGIKLVWRGGRRLKAPAQSSGDKHNGSTSDDAVMILDSDDDAPAAPPTSAPFVDKPEFEENPTANSSSLPEIVQTLDLALGTAVLHIAVLPMPPCNAEEAAWNGANILKDTIVFAVTCATSDVFVVTLPLTPPSNESKARPELRKDLLASNAGNGVWGETLTNLGGQNRPCDGAAITVIKHKSSSRSRSVERPGVSANPVTRVVVAAHSREASGTLRFWDVALDAKPGSGLTRVEPFQAEYLPSPLRSISFNPSHITQLMAVDSPNAVRLYDYSVPSLPSDDTSEGPFPTQGSWLLTLYPPFTRAPLLSAARKPIVAAEWISHGRAILTLLADGQWGIWDINGASPLTSTSSSSGGLFSKTHSGLRGSAITAFSVSGHVEGVSPLRNPISQKSAASSGSGGEFVPMTPHTRRDAIVTSATGSSEKLAAVKGGISVTQTNPTRGADTGDESAVLWLGGADPIISVIPVISRFWDSQIRRAGGGGVNLWSGAQPTRMIRLTDLNSGLLGERCTGAVAIPKLGRTAPGAPNGSSTASENNPNSSEGLPVEVLVQGETRVVFVHENEDAASFASRLANTRKKQQTKLGDSQKAIVTYPRSEKPNSVAFNLSVSRPKGGLFRPQQRAPAKNIFGDFGDDNAADVMPSTEGPDEGQASGGKGRDVGLLFVNDLSYAADVPDDEAMADNRDIEGEILGIMEIDRELDQMKSDREGGKKRVFFEEG
ncbi:hypothetical protein B0T17DRAFT_124868 [Bombardia bombarda]|uniref:Nucleoporin NUP37 n=1 Tax=Bombardia bombarda TaxID=252184 RepID=A0AA39T0U4_9PEZI|nr:hypothetical protein B0T17DRAFT_124868 [Bombardia bombarda]